MRFGFLFIYFIILFSTHSAIAQAAVTINEVAWMGGPDSSSYEWIEIYNSENTEVLVDGWVLEDGVNLNINLSGAVAPFEYAVLERTSDDTVSGTAFLIYTGALVNTGATLTLRNADGQIMDQISGGENWESIGGDNITKETAQYTTGGWVTDVATPGKQNGSGRVVDSVSTTVESVVAPSSSKKSTKGRKVETVKLGVLDTVLKLDTDIQTVAYVNQVIPFMVTGSGISKHIINSLKYDWNFGDMNVAAGPKVEHYYSYPGTYVVTVRAAYARHDQVVRHEITVLPVTFSITKNDAGDIQIHNDSPYDVDTSGYIVKGVNKDVVFPPRTIILPRSTITIPKEKLGNAVGSMIAIYDTERTLLASTYEAMDFMPGIVSEEKKVAVDDFYVEKTNTSVSYLPVLEEDSFGFDTSVVETFAEANEYPVAAVINSAYATTSGIYEKDEGKSAKQDSGNSKKPEWPYVAFIGLLAMAFAGLYWGRNNK
jgi:hypothetical protein